MTRVFALCSPADPTGAVKQFDLALPLLRERFDVVRHTLTAGGGGVRAARAALREANTHLLHTLGADAFRAARRWGLEAVPPWAPALPPWLAAGASAVVPALGLAPGLTAAFAQCEHDRDWAARLLPAPMQFSAKVAVATPAALAGRVRQDGHILAAGGFDAVANLKHVVWGFDAIRYTNPDLRLVLLGDGRLREEVQQFADRIGGDDPRVRCVGFQEDVTQFLHDAVQVWSTHTRGGTKFLLEAMAAGVPVIAARTPDTERIITDGVNGLLVPVARPVEMARAAHALLTSPDRRRAMVVAGVGVAARYPVADLARALAGVYDTLAPPGGVTRGVMR